MAATTATNSASTGTAHLPIEGFDSLTVKDILSLLAGLTNDELESIAAYEIEGKNRVTLIRGLRKEALAREKAEASGDDHRGGHLTLVEEDAEYRQYTRDRDWVVHNSDDAELDETPAEEEWSARDMELVGEGADDGADQDDSTGGDLYDSGSGYGSVHGHSAHGEDFDADQEHVAVEPVDRARSAARRTLSDRMHSTWEEESSVEHAAGADISSRFSQRHAAVIEAVAPSILEEEDEAPSVEEMRAMPAMPAMRSVPAMRSGPARPTPSMPMAPIPMAPIPGVELSPAAFEPIDEPEMDESELDEVPGLPPRIDRSSWVPPKPSPFQSLTGIMSRFQGKSLAMAAVLAVLLGLAIGTILARTGGSSAQPAPVVAESQVVQQVPTS